jgi:hypothetical protein
VLDGDAGERDAAEECAPALSQSLASRITNAAMNAKSSIKAIKSFPVIGRIFVGESDRLPVGPVGA